MKRTGRRPAAALALVLAAMTLAGCGGDSPPGAALAGLGPPLRPAGSAGVPNGPERIVRFAGRDWLVRASTEPGGPGPNRFANATDAVWVDAAGRLHLTLTRRDGVWWSTEVISQDAFGDGAYDWVIDSPVGSLDANVVLGLFTWSPQDGPAHREIDVEVARWGDGVDPTNAQFAVQPAEQSDQVGRIALHPFLPTSVGFTRDRGGVAFRADAEPPAWSSPLPVTRADAQVHINLWLFRGQPPTDGHPVEVIVKAFAFTPPGGG